MVFEEVIGFQTPPLPNLFDHFKMLSRSTLTRAARPISRSSALTKVFSTTALRRSDHAAATIFGEGAKAGTVPTDENQATGLERLQLLGRMEGVDVFARKPDFSRKGTMAEPVMVPSLVRLAFGNSHPRLSTNVLFFRPKLVLLVAPDTLLKTTGRYGILFIMMAGKPAARNAATVSYL